MACRCCDSNSGAKTVWQQVRRWNPAVFPDSSSDAHQTLGEQYAGVHRRTTFVRLSKFAELEVSRSLNCPHHTYTEMDNVPVWFVCPDTHLFSLDSGPRSSYTTDSYSTAILRRQRKKALFQISLSHLLLLSTHPSPSGHVLWISFLIRAYKYQTSLRSLTIYTHYTRCFLLDPQ